MLILGKKYNFTQLELEKLQKKFINIHCVDYRDQVPLRVIEDIEQHLLANSFTIIILNTKAKVDDEIIKYLTNLKYANNNINIISVEHFLENYLYKCYIPDDNTDLHYLDDIKPFTFLQRIQKKVVDYSAAILLLVIYFPLRFIVNLRIQKESPGKLYFKQTRVGLNNREFKCIKFRTMHDHDSEVDVRTATKDDDRVFPWGETMRKTRIDEIPQIFNILRGELHLIGPRAEWNKLTKEYEKEIPFYNQRHIVTPGITGWAQVMFAEGRSKDDTRQKLMYDLYYIKHWSIWLELKVIYKTILVVLGKKGI